MTQHRLQADPARVRRGSRPQRSPLVPRRLRRAASPWAAFVGAALLVAGAPQVAAETQVAAAERVAADGDDIAPGWTAHTFDFGIPSLNFRAAVPGQAKVETVPMEPPEAGTLGRVKIIGKIAAQPGAALPIETTIVGYALRSPGAALRICTYEARVAGYAPRITRVAPDQTEAQVYAMKPAQGEPRSALISYCFARGREALAIHFVADLGEARSPEAGQAQLRDVDAHAVAFMRPLRFADGEQANFGGGLQAVPLRLGARTRTIAVPPGWEIPINDFKGSLPAELHMVRRSQGRDVGLIWLWMQPMDDAPDLETAAPRMLQQYFSKQTPDARPLTLVSNAPDAELAEQGIDARRLRFTVADKAGESAGDLEARVTWHDGLLVVVSLWSAWADNDSRNDFFSRLPGATTYDLLRQAVTPAAAGTNR